MSYRDPKDWFKKEKPILDTFFNNIKADLEEFANRYNLKIEKYPNHFPEWCLVFRHPKGGCAQVEIRKWGNENFEIVSNWWYDDYKKLKRFIKYSPKRRVSCKTKNLRSMLDEMLRLILSWESGDLIAMSGICHWWKEVDKDTFEKDLESYPVLKL